METTTTTEATTLPQQIAELTERMDSLNVDMPMRLLIESHLTEAQASFSEAKFQNNRAHSHTAQAAEFMEQGHNATMALSDACRYAKQAANAFKEVTIELTAARQLIAALAA